MLAEGQDDAQTDREPVTANRPGLILIYLDMDGVIADTGPYAEATGVDMDDNDAHELDYDWWFGIPEVEGAREFYDEVCGLDELTQAKFLTGPKLTAECYAAKADWISKKFLRDRGKWALRDLIICGSTDKWLLAGPNRILIDDRKKNVEDWIAAGGRAVHHKGDFADTLRQVREIINEIRAPQRRPSGPFPSP